MGNISFSRKIPPFRGVHRGAYGKAAYSIPDLRQTDQVTTQSGRIRIDCWGQIEGWGRGSRGAELSPVGHTLEQTKSERDHHRAVRNRIRGLSIVMKEKSKWNIKAFRKKPPLISFFKSGGRDSIY